LSAPAVAIEVDAHRAWMSDESQNAVDYGLMMALVVIVVLIGVNSFDQQRLPWLIQLSRSLRFASNALNITWRLAANTRTPWPRAGEHNPPSDRATPYCHGVAPIYMWPRRPAPANRLMFRACL
jgi:hypothetical protein